MNRLNVFPALGLCLAVFLAGTAHGKDEGALYTQEDAALLDHCATAAREEQTNMADCIGVASNACQDAPGGASTLGMVQCMARETAWWDEVLNANYSTLRLTLDADIARSLRDAQRAWLAFRQADCSLRYDIWREGTIRSIVGADCQLEHTARRAIELETLGAM